MIKRESERALKHAMDHLENAKQDINFAENIIKKELERSQKHKRKDDENTKSNTD